MSAMRIPAPAPGVPLTPLVAALRQELPRAHVAHARGCDVRGAERSGI